VRPGQWTAELIPLRHAPPGTQVRMPLLTVGHGPDRRNRLGMRLTSAGVDAVVDVRRFPATAATPTSGGRRWPTGCQDRASRTERKPTSAAGVGCRRKNR
jgi:hypothetical protein